MIGVNHSGVCCKRMKDIVSGSIVLFELFYDNSELDKKWIHPTNYRRIDTTNADRKEIELQAGYPCNVRHRTYPFSVGQNNTIRKRIEGRIYVLTYDVDRNPYWVALNNSKDWAWAADSDLFYIELAYKQGGVAKNEHTYQGEIEQFSSQSKQTT